MMTLICAALTNTGIACTDVVPCVIFTKHHPAWVASGNESEGLELGPSRTPKMVKSDPWAIEPAGKPGVMKLAPLTIPRGAMSGWAKQIVDATKETIELNLGMFHLHDATERNAASAHETPEQPPGADEEEMRLRYQYSDAYAWYRTITIAPPECTMFLSNVLSESAQVQRPRASVHSSNHSKRE